MAYIESYKNQNWLLPLSIKEMIPADHICFLVEDFVESLDFSKYDMIYEGAGAPAYHPRIIMKILVYGMLCKTRSSRKLANATIESFIFMYLAEKVSPNWRTINRFRGFYTRKNGKKIASYYNAEIKKKKDVPYYFRERLRMKEKMNTPEGKKTYSLRKITVEPSFGNIKQNLGFREFLLRGLEKVKIEMNLVSIAHNLQKIYSMKRENQVMRRENSQCKTFFGNLFA